MESAGLAAAAHGNLDQEAASFFIFG